MAGPFPFHVNIALLLFNTSKLAVFFSFLSDMDETGDKAALL